MKTKMVLTVVIGAVLVFGLYGPAIAGGGGPEDPGGCTGTPPPADSGYFLRGEFTAAPYYDAILEVKFFVVAVSLKKGNTSRLFSFVAADVDDVCNVTATDLAQLFKWVPCRLGVAGAFGLVGVPVIANLEITQTDHCNTDGAMIRGEIVIRVVPLK
jgi:hypothetical protein